MSRVSHPKNIKPIVSNFAASKANLFRVTFITLVVVVIFGVIGGLSNNSQHTNSTESVSSADKQGVVKPILTNSAVNAPLTATPVNLSQDSLYILDPNTNTNFFQDTISSIIAVDPSTGLTQVKFPARYRPLATLSPDKNTLYVEDSYFSKGIRGDAVEALTAIDTRTQRITWEIDLPGKRAPYLVAPFQQDIWTSLDGQNVYILIDNTTLLKVDVRVRQVVKELKLDWPFNSECTHVWKVDQGDTLITVCSNQLLILDLASGQTQPSIALPNLKPAKFDQRLPISNKPLAIVNAVKRTGQIFVITSDLQVISTNPKNQAKVDQFDLKASAQWQPALLGVTTTSPDGQFFYIGVNKVGSPSSLPNFGPALLASEIWVYDTTTWQRLGTISLNEEASNLATSSDGSQLYVLSPNNQTLTIFDAKKFSPIKVVPHVANSPVLILGR